MNTKQTAILVVTLLIVAAVGIGMFLVLRPDSSDNNTEYEFKPLTEEQKKALSESLTAPSSESLLTSEEQAEVKTSSTAASGKSMLTPEQEEELRKATQAPAR